MFTIIVAVLFAIRANF